MANSPAGAETASRSWDFHLGIAGTYKVQVEHDASPSDAGNSKVSYTVSVGGQAQSRDLDYFSDHPFIPLIMNIPRAEDVRVVIAGISQPALARTRVYVYDAKSQFPGEYFDPTKSTDLKDAQRVRAILRKSADQIDLARAKVTIDNLVDPTVDITGTLKTIEAMVGRIRTMPEFGNSSDAKLIALKRYLYEAGDWNDHKAFQYDLDDPLGKNIKNKLLSNYIATRRGNCVTMPFLFIVLGQRLGLEVTASTAPEHFLVKYNSAQYGWINLEATSGANPARDVWVRQQNPMTDQALTNGVYLQPLSRKETVAEMATIVAESYLNHQQYEQAIAMADLILEYYSKDVGTMVLKGTAYGRLGRQTLAEKFPPPAVIPDSYRGYFAYLAQNNSGWFSKAEALGWREETREDEGKYLRRVDQARQRSTAN